MDDLTIPDAAVEAAAALIYETRTYRLWADAPDDIKDSWRGDTLEILAAAAPHIAAQERARVVAALHALYEEKARSFGPHLSMYAEGYLDGISKAIARIEADHG